jgi:hypothetical protein
MKTIAIALLALIPAVAQIRPVEMTQPAPAPEAAKMPASTAAGTIPAAGGAHVSLDALKVLQTGFDTELATFDYNDSIDVIGRTRGIYLSDYGVVFTSELSPIVTPGITPFMTKISDEMKLRVHQRKIERMPAVKKLMGQMMKRTAEQLALLPDDQQIVLAVKLLYLPYEDTQGLPLQIVMKGDKRSVLKGKYTTIEE